MKICDLSDKVSEVSSLAELETLLGKRYEHGVNSFWLSPDDSIYPTLSLLVKNELATLKYIPREHEAGFQPTGNVLGLDTKGTVEFPISNVGDCVEVPNEELIPISTALKAATEFFSTEDLPPSINWSEL